MKVAFRADASLDMGTGHVMRCLTLAQSLADRGARIHFVCREHEGHLAAQIAAQGFQLTLLARETVEPTKNASAYAEWVGAKAERDAEQTVAALSDDPPDWVVVDHYGLDATWERLVGGSGLKILAIDDLANREHTCEALLDQNYFAGPEGRYDGLVAPECSLWLGPRYALLGRAFAGHRRLADDVGDVRSILIFVGGSDRTNLTGALLLILSGSAFHHLKLDVVLGPNNEHRDAVEELARSRPLTDLHSNLPSLVDVMASADLAIGAGGGATWERLCVGLPSIVFSLAPNQEAICEELFAAGLITYAGRLEAFEEAVFNRQLTQLIEDPLRRRDQVLRGQAMVDGLGASRITEILMPTASEELACRPARADDMLDYFNWANDSVVRASAISTAPIPIESHARWFEGKLRSPNSWLYVLEATGTGVGQVRFDREADDVWIDYSLDRLVRGRGWGQKLVRLGASSLPLPGEISVRARVKLSNPASAAVFRRLGFSESIDGDVLLFTIQLDQLRQSA